MPLCYLQWGLHPVTAVLCCCSRQLLAVHTSPQYSFRQVQNIADPCRPGSGTCPSFTCLTLASLKPAADSKCTPASATAASTLLPVILTAEGLQLGNLLANQVCTQTSTKPESLCPQQVLDHLATCMTVAFSEVIVIL